MITQKAEKKEKKKLKKKDKKDKKRPATTYYTSVLVKNKLLNYTFRKSIFLWKP